MAGVIMRSPSSQAEWGAREVREAAAENGEYTTSLNPSNAYERTYEAFVEWQREDGDMRGLKNLTADQINEYLQERAQEVGQSQLDVDRQALTAFAATRGVDTSSVGRVMSEKETPADALSQVSRVYTAEQIEAITERQQDHNALATLVAWEGGLRAKELETLERAENRPATEREWSQDRWAGREGELYTVIGKGNLCREVMLSKETSALLEERRLETPERVTDRGIYYQKAYDIGGGQAWSQSFTRASQAALGESLGAHSMRHTFVEERLSELKEAGFSTPKAEATVSQELGHFREDITREHYIR